ncbi:MAG: hypothetical protein CL678_07000 [Bdellovibrionaceae bacterium]|nr:hypothetical protein [Pseudobdellovibrionaceae bacterium]
MGNRLVIKSGFSLMALIVFSGCPFQTSEVTEVDRPDPPVVGSCALPSNPGTFLSRSPARVFLPDPIGSTGKKISPFDSNLDQWSQEVEIKDLNGSGVLSGVYTTVGNGLSCGGDLFTFSENEFVYHFENESFQEVMTYHLGSSYRKFLNQLGYLQPGGSILMIAHCILGDNAYFSRNFLGNGEIFDYVCFGDSPSLPNAHYSDDGQVVIHELQHATTVAHYSNSQYFNQFRYDEAGALNEAISDFMAMGYTEPWIHPDLDSRFFSHWALGTFTLGINSSRGSHRCPRYSAGFPECKHYASGASGFSADRSEVSFSYPDGLGWPFADLYGTRSLKDLFEIHRGKEQIHNNSSVMTGAFWDAYEALKQHHSQARSFELMSAAILEAVKHLPKPTSFNLSPIRFIGFVDSLLTWAPLTGMTSTDIDLLKSVFEQRGLFNYPELPKGWLALGPGSLKMPGIQIIDHPVDLRVLFSQSGRNPRVVKQSIDTGLNGVANPGEVIAVWFDLKNISSFTAGGLQVRVHSPTPDVEIMNAGFNYGAISSSVAETIYSKVNGTSIVTALKSTDTHLNIETDNTYFKTQNFFNKNLDTSIIVRISDHAQSQEVLLDLEVTPSNGPTEMIQVPLEIYE